MTGIRRATQTPRRLDSATRGREHAVVRVSRASLFYPVVAYYHIGIVMHKIMVSTIFPYKVITNYV